jgi:hypothetical protein
LETWAGIVNTPFVFWPIAGDKPSPIETVLMAASVMVYATPFTVKPVAWDKRPRRTEIVRSKIFFFIQQGV